MGQLKQFLTCLFDEHETTCFSESPKGTNIYNIYPYWNEEHCKEAFFAINSLLFKQDKNPVEEWHQSDRGRRADCNVTAFRNILVEMDKMPLDAQDQYISEIGMPYSTAVYSGGKSIHYIISLQTDLPGAKEYRELVERVYRAVGKDKVDLSNKNPSRLSRVPGHFRADTQEEQKLLAVNGRVANSVLEEWLLKRGATVLPEEEWQELPKRFLPKDVSALHPDTRRFLISGANENWNFSLFKAAADLCRHGWSVEEAFNELKRVTGTLDGNDTKTIRSAYRNEENQR